MAQLVATIVSYLLQAPQAAIRQLLHHLRHLPAAYPVHLARR